MSPLLYQLSYTARKDGKLPREMIQEWFGDCLARRTHGARRAGQTGFEVLGSGF
jgi:hypothetical protein